MTGALPPAGPQVALLGPWWTFDAPSLRVADRHHRYVSVWSAGDAGPSVLLVPAPGEDHTVWETWLPELTDSFVVHAMDVPPGAGADVEAVGTALVAVGAVVVVARGEAASDVLAACQVHGVARAVVWDPPTALAASTTAATEVHVVRGAVEPGRVLAALRTTTRQP